MKVLQIEVDNAFYPTLLEVLNNLPANKITIVEAKKSKTLSFEEAMEYTLDKNKELYQRLS